jgi:hypothetical protein
MSGVNKVQQIARKRTLLLLFLFIYCILSVLLFDPKLSTGGDNAIYIILAESISNGRGYKNIHMPDEPEHTQYPFGFPLLLALFMLLFGSNVIGLKVFIFLFGCGATYFVYKIGSSLLKEYYIPIMLFYLSIPIFVLYNHWIYSEIPFLFFSLGALYFLLKAQKDKSYFYYISFGFATYSFFIRTAGISLIIAVMIYLLIRKEFKYFGIFLLIFAAVFIPWQIRNMGLVSEGNYLDQLLAKDPYRLELGRITPYELLLRMRKNFSLYTYTILPMTVFPLFNPGSRAIVVGVILIILTIIGFMTASKKSLIMKLYFILTILMILAWPSDWSSDRFLLPILPFFILFIFFAIHSFKEKIRLEYLPYIVTGVFVALNIIDLVPRIKDTVTDNIEYVRGDKYAGYMTDWKCYFVIIELVKETVPEDNIVMARKPEFVYLVSRRKSFLFPFTTDHDELMEAIMRADYIIFDSFLWSGTTKRVLWPVLEQHPELYDIVCKTNDLDFFLLKVIKE